MSRTSERRAAARPLWWYLRTHRFVALVIGLPVGALLLAATQATTRAIDTLDGYGSTPLSVAAICGMGALAATTWTTSGGAQEDALLTRIPARVRGAHPLLASLLAIAATAATVLALHGDIALTLITARATLGWSALGFISAVIGGAKAAWAGPAAGLLAILTAGYQPDGTPTWWNIAMSPPQASTWALVAVLVATAALLIHRSTR